MPGGRLADRLGVRTSFLGGLALGAAALTAGAWAPGFPTFLLALFVAGIGWSVVNPALGPRHHRPLPRPRARHRHGHQADGAHAGRLRRRPGAAHGAARAGLARRHRHLRRGGGGPGRARPGARWLRWAPARRRRSSTGAPASPAAGAWEWLGRPALVVFFATGLVLGMVQAAVLSYLPLYAVQALGFDKIGAGLLVACSQAGGAVSRLVAGRRQRPLAHGAALAVAGAHRRRRRGHLPGLRGAAR